jgi:hypothetical protein
VKLIRNWKRAWMSEAKTMLPKEGPVLRTSAAWMVCVDVGGGIGAEGLEKNNE